MHMASELIWAPIHLSQWASLPGTELQGNIFHLLNEEHDIESLIWFQRPQQTSDAQLTFIPQACGNPQGWEAFLLGWTQFGIQNQIVLPETIMFHIQARNTVVENNLKTHLIGSCPETCAQALLSYSSCFLSMECLLGWGSSCVYYAVARKCCVFQKDQMGFQRERESGSSWVQVLESLITSHSKIW